MSRPLPDPLIYDVCGSPRLLPCLQVDQLQLIGCEQGARVIAVLIGQGDRLVWPDYADQLFTRPAAPLDAVKHLALLLLNPDSELYGDEGWFNGRLSVSPLAGTNGLYGALPRPGKVGYGSGG